MSENIRVAIDGPSGAGKSTLARSVAARLNFLYVDTGAIYRTIGYAVWRKGIDPRDRSAVVAVLPDLEICLTYGTDGLQHMELNGMDVTAEIRLPEVSRYASLVSAYPEVRAYLLEMQRQLARENSVVMDGRDIGTVVLPDAEVKVFLTASAEERARRRMLELEERGTPAGGVPLRLSGIRLSGGSGVPAGDAAPAGSGEQRGDGRPGYRHGGAAGCGGEGVSHCFRRGAGPPPDAGAGGAGDAGALCGYPPRHSGTGLERYPP